MLTQLPMICPHRITTPRSPLVSADSYKTKMEYSKYRSAAQTHTIDIRTYTKREVRKEEVPKIDIDPKWLP